jgi:hypothetical protein
LGKDRAQARIPHAWGRGLKIETDAVQGRTPRVACFHRPTCGPAPDRRGRATPAPPAPAENADRRWDTPRSATRAITGSSDARRTLAARQSRCTMPRECRCSRPDTTWHPMSSTVRRVRPPCPHTRTHTHAHAHKHAYMFKHVRTNASTHRNARGHTWAHMGTHGHTWAHMGTHGHTWAHMGTHGHTRKTPSPYRPKHNTQKAAWLGHMRGT